MTDEDTATGFNWIPLRRLLSEPLLYGANESGDRIEPTDPRYVRITDVAEDGSLRADTFRSLPEELAKPYILKSGDVLLARSGATVGKSFLYKESWGRCCFAGYMIRARCDSRKLDPRFFSYYLASSIYWDWVRSNEVQATIQNLSAEKYASLRVPLPPIPRQRAIADFLDGETAKINALIAKQEELIQRVNESRSAVIYRAITRGINPTVEVADSGLVWLGAIPRHWAISPLKYLVTFASGGTPNKDTPAFWNGGIPWVSPKDMKRAVIDSSEDTVSDAALQSTNLSLQPVGSILIVVRGMILARYVPVAENSVPVTINQDMKAMLVKGRNLPSFIRHYLTNIPHVLSTLIEEAGHGTKTLRTELLAAVPVPMPPPHEQGEIVDFINREDAAADSLISQSKAFIELLRERRSALITAAVTGRVDARSNAVESKAVPVNDNRQALRAVVGAEIVSRQGSAKNFGRVKLQKLIYLAEVHAGIHELAGKYVRQAAGPLAPDLLSDTERGMEARGFYRTVPPTNEGDGYIYSRIGKAGAHGDQFAAMLGDRAATLTELIDRFRDYDTRQVEAITTLYAVWNDALIDGETPTDDRIIRGVLEEWHPEKRDKFTASDLKTWLAWMRRNGVVPTGTGSRTQLDRLFV